jgi:hypothetical protein
MKNPVNDKLQANKQRSIEKQIEDIIKERRRLAEKISVLKNQSIAQRVTPKGRADHKLLHELYDREDRLNWEQGDLEELLKGMVGLTIGGGHADRNPDPSRTGSWNLRKFGRRMKTEKYVNDNDIGLRIVRSK